MEPKQNHFYVFSGNQMLKSGTDKHCNRVHIVTVRGMCTLYQAMLKSALINIAIEYAS